MITATNPFTKPSRLAAVAAFICAVAALLVPGRARANDDEPRVERLPPVKDLSPKCLYPYHSSCVYELPKDYVFTDECQGAPSLNVLPNGSAPRNRFEDRPSASPKEFRGYNLRVAKKGTSPKKDECPRIQVLLLADDTDRDLLSRISGTPDSGDGVQPALVRHEAAGAPVRSRPLGPPAARLTELIGDGNAWFFVTPQPKEKAITVKLPKLHGKLRTTCEGGKTVDLPEVTFPAGKVSLSIDLGTCDALKKQRVARVELDALGLFTAANSPPSFWAAAANKLRLEPANAAGAVGVRLENDTLSERPDLLVWNFLAEKGKARGELSSCKTGSCVWEIPHDASDPVIAVQWDTPTTRELLGKFSDVFYANGEVVEDEHATISPGVKNWVLPQGIIPISIKPGPRADPRIPVLTAAVDRLLSTSGRPIPCTHDKDKSIAECATFHREGNGGYLTLESKALEQVQNGGRKLSFALAPPSIHKDISVKSEDGQPVTLEIRTEVCSYSFQQLTYSIAGTKDGEVLYWVESTPGCLCAPLRARAAGANVTVKRVTEWLPASSTCGPRTKGRLLKISLAEVSSSDQPRDLQLAATLSSTDDGEAVPTKDGNTFPLHVERGIDMGAVRVDVETDGVVEGTPNIVGGVQSFAVDRNNRLWFPRSVEQPWRLRLSSLGHHAPGIVSPYLGGAQIIQSADPHVLPQATHDGLTVYFIQGTSAADSGLALMAELEGPVDKLLVRPQAVPADALDALKLLRDTLRVGAASVTLGDRKTQPLWTPFDLKRDVSLWCPPFIAGIRPGTPTRAIKRDEYRRCELRVVVHRDVTMVDSSTKATRSQSVNWSIDERRFRRRWGTQRIKVELDNGDEALRKTVAVLTEKDVGSKMFAIDDARTDDNGRRVTTRRMVIAFPLPDLLGLWDKPVDYTTFHVRISHAPDGELGDALKGAYLPASHADARKDGMSVRTILVPRFSTRWLSPSETSWGLRHYVAATANLSLYRTRDPGFSPATSTDYAKKVQANIGYGLIYVMDLWNFSANDTLLPYVSPQFNVGVLGPTDFNRREWWRDFSLVVGFTARLPAASKPEPGKVEAQTGLIAWYELTGGARDAVIHSFLFGLNVNIGALAP